MIVFFDLPTKTLGDKREYRKFRKHLLQEGFFMMQESVYTKIVLNTTMATRVRKSLKDNKPRAGLVQILLITEKQFAKIDYLVGEYTGETIDSAERLVVL